MGNRIGNLCLCSAGAGEISGRFDNSMAFLSKQHDKALGDSICYVRPDPHRFSGDAVSDDDVTRVTFRSVSSATVSANSSAAPSTSLDDSLQHDTVLDSSASFESSGSFTSTMMMHAPSGFSVGGFVKSPCDDRVLNGGSIEKGYGPEKKLQRSLCHSGCGFQSKPCSRNLRKFLSGSFFSTEKRSIFKNNGNANARVSCSTSLSGDGLRLHSDSVEDDNKCLDDDGGGGGGGCDMLKEGCQNLHWAHGRAGEDRLHILICEEHGWVFVGIYDGFNGPDATDYLLNNLFYAVHDELKKLLCSHRPESMSNSLVDSNSLEVEEKVLLPLKGNGVVDGGCSSSFNKENCPIGNGNFNLDCSSKRVEGMNSRNSNKDLRVKWEREGDDEKMDLEKMMQVNLSLADAKSEADFSHLDVLQALSEALRKTEEAFLKTADEMITHNPVLAMMGSCVLVMLMKGEDVYLMNVGDSRAVLATQTGNSLQLTNEHSTHVKQEVHRIRREHPDDPSAVTKGRVKGYLSVTRAFGAGFLKQPKQNNAVLETFRVNYIGDSPYITCCPSLHHHRLSPNDKFLILSSDGLYQYFTNEEAVAKVESFITMFPDRDPAQLLIEEALSRAAKKAGMKFHELLDIPHGERRLYHDDISIVIISLEGKIWRSLV